MEGRACYFLLFLPRRPPEQTPASWRSREKVLLSSRIERKNRRGQGFRVLDRSGVPRRSVGHRRNGRCGAKDVMISFGGSQGSVLFGLIS